MLCVQPSWTQVFIGLGCIFAAPAAFILKRGIVEKKEIFLSKVVLIVGITSTIIPFLAIWFLLRSIT